MKRLTVASTNPGKIREVRLALGDLPGWSVAPLPEGFTQAEETGVTFMENAVLKATHYSRQMGGLVLADDAGLCVRALDGRPGVWTARYGRNDEDGNRRILAELAELDELETSASREAAFHCVFAVALEGAVVWSTEAELVGEIAQAPAGTAGFGFDPIFFVPELRKTLAQLTSEEKNRISARGKALMELRRFLTTP